MIRNAIHTLIGAVVTFVALNIAQRWHRVQSYAGHLVPAEIAPGPWFAYYTGDFMTEFDTQNVTSVIVQLKDGTYLWATNTPEWDRDWFEEHVGWEFPARWVPFDALADYDLEATEMG